MLTSARLSQSDAYFYTGYLDRYLCTSVHFRMLNGIQFRTDPMMDHFLSSVISMVAPTWCHGPIGGNPVGRLLTEWMSEFTIFNLVIRLRKWKQSAFFPRFTLSLSGC